MKFVGVDFGINPFAITSDGRKFHINRLPDIFYAHEYSSSVVGAFAEFTGTSQDDVSNLKDIGRLHQITKVQAEVLRPIISDLIEHLTGFDVIALEDIQIEGMHFEHEMRMLGFPDNVNIIYEESLQRGKKVHLVEMKGTSRECSHCGNPVRNEKGKEKPIKLNLFRCQNEGCPLSQYWIDKDINAALNIRNKILSKYLNSDEILQFLGLA